MGKKLCDLMYDILGKVKENSLPDDRISEENLGEQILQFLFGQDY